MLRPGWEHTCRSALCRVTDFPLDRASTSRYAFSGGETQMHGVLVALNPHSVRTHLVEYALSPSRSLLTHSLDLESGHAHRTSHTVHKGRQGHGGSIGASKPSISTLGPAEQPSLSANSAAYPPSQRPRTLVFPRVYRGISLIRNRPPPRDHHMTLGIVLLKGPRRGVFLMSEVPLYMTCVTCGYRHAPPQGPTVGLVLGASDHPEETKGCATGVPCS